MCGLRTSLRYCPLLWSSGDREAPEEAALVGERPPRSPHMPTGYPAKGSEGASSLVVMKTNLMPRPGEALKEVFALLLHIEMSYS